MAENGKVIVTGCMGAEPDQIRDRFPNLLAITGPQAYESVVAAVHRASPPVHDAFSTWCRRKALSSRRATTPISRFGGLQQPLLVLHHPKAARRPGQSSGGRRSA
jgi:tRNA A37 methylthiotransferase MiaB